MPITDPKLKKTKEILRQMVIDFYAESRGGFQLQLIGEAAVLIHKLYTDD